MNLDMANLSAVTMTNALDAAKHINVAICRLDADHAMQAELREAMHNVLIIAEQARQGYEAAGREATRAMTAPAPLSSDIPRGKLVTLDGCVRTAFMTRKDDGRLHNDIRDIQERMDAVSDTSTDHGREAAYRELWHRMHLCWPFIRSKAQQLLPRELQRKEWEYDA
jgi:hypothetical protein